MEAAAPGAAEDIRVLGAVARLADQLGAAGLLDMLDGALIPTD